MYLQGDSYRKPSPVSWTSLRRVHLYVSCIPSFSRGVCASNPVSSHEIRILLQSVHDAKPVQQRSARGKELPRNLQILGNQSLGRSRSITTHLSFVLNDSHGTRNQSCCHQHISAFKWTPKRFPWQNSPYVIPCINYSINS